MRVAKKFAAQRISPRLKLWGGCNRQRSLELFNLDGCYVASTTSWRRLSPRVSTLHQSQRNHGRRYAPCKLL